MMTVEVVNNKPNVFICHGLKQQNCFGSGCGTVDSAFAGSKFESGHRQLNIFTVNCLQKRRKYTKRGPF